MTISEIKAQEQEKLTVLNDACGLFWAFSNSQFAENKTPLKEGERYVQIGGGGFMPKGFFEQWKTGMDEIEKWFQSEVNKDAAIRRSYIMYELSNHEAWYTGDIESAMDTLGEGYTPEEVWKVYNEEKSAVDARN